MATKIPPLWNSLSTASKDKIITYVKHAQVKETLPLFRFLIQHPECEDDIKLKIKMLDEKGLADGINIHELAPLLIDRAIDVYGECRNWVHANSIYENIINPIQGILTKENIENLSL